MSLRVKELPCFIFRPASPFNETLRELYATRPLRETPIDPDNARLVQEEPHIPLRALGCLAWLPGNGVQYEFRFRDRYLQPC